VARQVDLISTRTSTHYLLIGLDANELSSFKLMMWITKYEARVMDWAQSLGLNFITFLGGDLWIHNDDNQDRCNLFGEKRNCIVGVVSNEQPLRIKTLDSTGIYSNSAWEVVSITIPPTLNYPDGQYSKIPLEQFKKRNGVWQAKFLRNLKSSSDTESILDAIQGEQLKGQEAYMVLRNTSNEQVKLFQVVVNSTTSR
jgi:hypothetical protein